MSCLSEVGHDDLAYIPPSLQPNQTLHESTYRCWLLWLSALRLSSWKSSGLSITKGLEAKKGYATFLFPSGVGLLDIATLKTRVALY